MVSAHFSVEGKGSCNEGLERNPVWKQTTPLADERLFLPPFLPGGGDDGICLSSPLHGCLPVLPVIPPRFFIGCIQFGLDPFFFLRRFVLIPIRSAVNHWERNPPPPTGQVTIEAIIASTQAPTPPLFPQPDVFSTLAVGFLPYC